MIKAYIYNTDTMELVAVSVGETQAEAEEKASIYMGCDEYGVTYTPSFGAVGGLVRTTDYEKL